MLMVKYSIMRVLFYILIVRTRALKLILCGIVETYIHYKRLSGPIQRSHKLYLMICKKKKRAHRQVRVHIVYNILLRVMGEI